MVELGNFAEKHNSGTDYASRSFLSSSKLFRIKLNSRFYLVEISFTLLSVNLVPLSKGLGHPDLGRAQKCSNCPDFEVQN